MRAFLLLTAVLCLSWGSFLGVQVYRGSHGSGIVYQYAEFPNLVGAKPSIKPKLSTAAFSPSGAFVAGASGPLIFLWKTKDNEPVHVLMRHAARVKTLRFSPKGRYLTSLSEDGDFRLWDLNKGEQVLIYQRLSAAALGRILDVGFSPDGSQVLAWTNRSELVFWDTLTGQETLSFFPLGAPSITKQGNAFFLADGQHAFVSDLQTYAQVLDVATRKPSFTPAFSDDMMLEQFSQFQPAGPDGFLGLGLGKAVLWKLESPTSEPTHVPFETKQDVYLKAAAFQAPGWLALAGIGPQVQLRRRSQVKIIELPSKVAGESVLAISALPNEGRLHAITERHHISWNMRSDAAWLTP